jgi:hypothetical protein
MVNYICQENASELKSIALFIDSHSESIHGLQCCLFCGNLSYGSDHLRVPNPFSVGGFFSPQVFPDVWTILALCASDISALVLFAHVRLYLDTSFGETDVMALLVREPRITQGGLR